MVPSLSFPPKDPPKDRMETPERPDIPFEEREYYRTRRRVTDRPPEGKGRLGPFTVVCLVLNRTIGE